MENKRIVIDTEEKLNQLGEYCYKFYKLGYKRAIKDLNNTSHMFDFEKHDSFMKYFKKLSKGLL